MLSLVKTDLKRIIKDKLFLITCIIGGAFAIITPLLNSLVFSMLDMTDIMNTQINAKSLFAASFSPSGDFGLIAPILISIIICKDFSYGTVRNKIISGKSRASIFLSTFISSAITICFITLAYSLVTLFFSLILFGYQPNGAFDAGDFGHIILTIIFGMLVCIFISALVSFLSVFMKNVGLSIVMYAAINFIFVIIGTIFSVAYSFSDPSNKFLNGLFEFLSKSNLFTSGLVGGEYSFENVMYILIPSIVFSALFVLLGIVIFKKKDIK